MTAKLLLVLFIVGIPTVLYKAFKEPVWCALAAAYLYYMIPGREFSVGEAPYQVAFWALGVLLSAVVYRDLMYRRARQEIEETALSSVQAAVDAVRGRMKEAMIDTATQPWLPGEVRNSGFAAVEEQALAAIDSRAPRAVSSAVRRTLLTILHKASEVGEQEAQKVRENARAATAGNLRAAMSARISAAADKALDEAVKPLVTERVEEAIKVADDRQAREVRAGTAALGPMGIPLPRGPLLGLLSNPGLYLHLAFMVLTYIGVQNVDYINQLSAEQKFETEYLLLIPMVSIICCVRDQRHVRMFIFAWMVGVAHLSYNAVNHWIHYGGRSDDVGGQGGESNFLGAIIVTVAPVAFGMVLNEKSRRGKLLGLFFAALLCLGVIASGSRGALVALLGSAAYWLFHTNRKGIAAGIGAVAFACFLLVAPEDFWQRMGTIIGPADSNPWVQLEVEPSKHERQVLWGLAIDLYQKHPLMGIGPAQFPIVSAAMTDFTDAYLNQRGLQTHNSWLQIAAEFGTMGIMVWGGAFFLSMACYRMARRRLAQYPGQEWLASMCLGMEAGSLGSAIAITFSSFQWYDYHYWHFVFGPLVYQVAKERAERLDWLKPIGLSDVRPPPRYGPPLPDGLDVEHIDLSNAPIMRPDRGSFGR